MKQRFLIYLAGAMFLIMTGKEIYAQPMVSLGGDRYNDQDIVREVQYYAALLGLDKRVSIRINFTLKLPEGIMGSMDHRVIGNFAQVVIWINRKAGRSAQMNILAHEMIHARQLLFQEMKQLKKHKVAWKDGRTYDLREISYHDRPWEEDADRRSTQLRRQFLSHVNAGSIIEDGRIVNR